MGLLILKQRICKGWIFVNLPAKMGEFFASVAQLDRALVFGTKGRGFDSLRTHRKGKSPIGAAFTFYASSEGVERAEVSKDSDVASEDVTNVEKLPVAGFRCPGQRVSKCERGGNPSGRTKKESHSLGWLLFSCLILSTINGMFLNS